MATYGANLTDYYGRPLFSSSSSKSSSKSSSNNAALSQLQNYYAGLEAQARAENLAAEKEVRGIRESQIKRYGKDSAFYQAGLADIQNQTQELIGAETQNLVSSGLYGTTTAASVPTRIANTFERPARLKLESLREEKQSAAELGMADFIERIERPYPDYAALFQASQAAGTR